MQILPQDARMVAIRNILTRLCKYSGLSSDRLRSTEIDVAPLLELVVVRQRAHRTGAAPEESVIPVVRDMARRLQPTDRLIADAALSLGLLRESSPDGIDLERLYAENLGQRREYLAEQWQRLHDSLGAEVVPEAPTVKRLRTSSEHEAFTALAGLLAGDRSYTIPAPGPTPKIVVSLTDSQPRAGRVTVVGDAVIDHLYRVDRHPSVDAPAHGIFEEHPGGKGLNRAVAAARLGLEVHIISALGDDENGRRILEYLDHAGVHSELIKSVPLAPSPITAVITTANGEMALIGCQNHRVRLEAADLLRPDARAAIGGSDVVLLTFEHAVGVVEQVLEMVSALRPKPRLIVCPTPNLPVPQDLYRYLHMVDYLVGSAEELAKMIPDVTTASSEDVAGRLRGLGVRAVCTVGGFRCEMRSDYLSADITHYPRALKNAPGAAAAFSAALAYRVVASDGPLQAKDLDWATAAMLLTQKLGDVPSTMPLTADIDEIVERYAGGR
ncbi:PfkB family carbohydrate kinase [Nocardia australiensis]|uniref:PfkB family carbohydrate kinase n=1 Tax=Nocardia australiensis TaxID=2887191 RepID=UPI001D15344D|nr:PfkB family carbohydrate kinase [Nocardia australiensis]